MILRRGALAIATVVLLAMSYWLFVVYIGNPRVIRELMEQPDGARARRVMLLTLPSGRSIPVNYLREDDMVYAGADGGWWRELRGDEVPVTLLLRGEALAGTARAVLDDPAYRHDVFDKLRPNAIESFGTLVEIRLGDRVRVQ